MTVMPLPVVGDIVLYTTVGLPGGRSLSVRPAIVLKVGPGQTDSLTLTLKVFCASGDFYAQDVEYSGAEPGSLAARGCWGWKK